MGGSAGGKAKTPHPASSLGHPLPWVEGKRVIARRGAPNSALALSPGERENVIARGGAPNPALALSPGERENVIARGGAPNSALALSPGERENVIARGGAPNSALALSPGGEGKRHRARWRAQLSPCPLPWGEGGRGTRPGEGSLARTHALARAESVRPFRGSNGRKVNPFGGPKEDQCL